MMKRFSMSAITLALVLNASVGGHAWAQSALTDGLVTKVDPSTSKITIRHGPIKKFDMDEGMTMVFRAQDPEMLKTVKAGDKVKFNAENVNGQFVVTEIEKSK